MTILEKDTPDVEAGCTVADLRVALTGRDLDVVDEINIELRPGEVVGLVGESGSGKTTAGTALLAYSRRGAFIERGTVHVRGPGRAGPALGAGPRDPRHEDRLRAAGPGRGAEPGHPDRPPDRRAAGAARHRHRRAAPRRVPGPGCARSGCPTTTSSWPATRTSSPAARCSGSRWPWPSCPGPRCWCSTSRPPAWTSPPRAWCCGPWASCAAATGSRRCTSRTTWPWWPTSPTGSPSCTPGGSSSSGPRDAMFRQPAHPYTRALLDAIPHLSQARALTGIPGTTPGPGAAPVRLPVPRPLRVRAGPLPGDRAAGLPGRPGPHREVPARRRDRQLGHQPRQHHRRRPEHRRGTSS